MLGPLTPLGDFLTGALDRDIPKPALQVMRLCAFDWAICGLGTLRGPILSEMIQHAVHAGSGAASTFYMRDVADHGGAQRVPARVAALINGTISHALDFDDTHFDHIGHVSTVVIPAALAVAETEGQDFETCIKAARLGAEVAVRVGLWPVPLSGRLASNGHRRGLRCGGVGGSFDEGANSTHLIECRGDGRWAKGAVWKRHETAERGTGSGPWCRSRTIGQGRVIRIARCV